MGVLKEVTTIAAALGAIAAFVTGIVNRKKIQQVHVLVNSQLSNVIDHAKVSDARIEQLVAALRTSDTDVPPKPGKDAQDG